MTQMASLPTFKYQTMNIGDVRIAKTYDKKGKAEVRTLQIGDTEAKPSNRFWDSLCSKFGFGPSVFNYFTHHEVFDRINSVSAKNKIRVTIQADPDDGVPSSEFEPIALGVSNPDRHILRASQAAYALNNLEVKSLAYHDGVISSTHPPRNEVSFNIGGDDHATRLALETPVDGYGRPNVYLSLLRQICLNGMVARGKAFQSQINLGNDSNAFQTLERVVQAYNNEDGFIALKQRVTASQNSWASVFEMMRLSKMLWRVNNDDFKASYINKNYQGNVEKDKLRNDILRSLYNKSGDVRAIYGVAQIDAISKKKMRTLPTKAKTYDLINFATEAATHWFNQEYATKMHAFVGDLVSNEYDLENSVQDFAEFDDFLNPATAKAISN